VPKKPLLLTLEDFLYIVISRRTLLSKDLVEVVEVVRKIQMDMQIASSDNSFTGGQKMLERT